MLRPLAVVLSAALLASGTPPAAEIAFTPDHQLNYPADYRQWVYLTSGLGMSYNPQAPPHPMFDNVFVNPTAYKAFLATGTWPDKTALVLEVRGADSHVSIDHHGQSQTPEIMGLEVHVRDASLPGKWGFYEFNADKPAPAKIVARPAACYTCHEANAAVDTTFTQFYPTLLPIAKAKNTLSPAYLKQISPGAAAKP